MIMKKCVQCRTQIELMVPLAVCSGGVGTVSEVTPDPSVCSDDTTNNAPPTTNTAIVVGGGVVGGLPSTSSSVNIDPGAASVSSSNIANVAMFESSSTSSMAVSGRATAGGNVNCSGSGNGGASSSNISNVVTVTSMNNAPPQQYTGPIMNNGSRDTKNDITKLQQQLQDIKEQVS